MRACSAEVLKGSMDVEVFTFEGCPICTCKASKIHTICISQGFTFKMTPLNDSEPDREWVLEKWPHIKVSGHEVREDMLEELAVEATLLKNQRQVLSNTHPRLHQASAQPQTGRLEPTSLRWNP